MYKFLQGLTKAFDTILSKLTLRRSRRSYKVHDSAEMSISEWLVMIGKYLTPQQLEILIPKYLTLQQQESYCAILANPESFSYELQKHPDLQKSLQALILAVQADSSSARLTELCAIISELRPPVRSPQEMPRRIELCRLALSLVVREVDASLWAALHNELANSLVQSPEGLLAENLEAAIAHYEQVLTVMTREADPANWAMAQNNLANAYELRIRGERVDNQERAIAHYELALTVYTCGADPTGWARAQHNLANAYSRRISGKRAENQERAIEHFQLAQIVYTAQAYPEDWAGLQQNLANVFSRRIRGERAENQEQAIGHYQWALRVYSPQAYPADWAMVQHNLALAYGNRIRGERAENQERAIGHCQKALTVYSHQAYPADWAMVQGSLANSYLDRLRGERAENLDRAITYYQQTLQIYTLRRFPTHFQDTQRSLGNLHFGEGTWADALTAYQEAIRAEQVLLGGAYTEVGRQAEVAHTAKLYASSSYALLKLGRENEALLQLEKGKTRLLSQALTLNETDVNFLPMPQQDILRGLRQTLRELESEMRLPVDTPARRDGRVLAAALDQARSELKDVIKLIRTEHPAFMSEDLSLPEILALIPPGSALVAFLITSQGSAVFVVPTGQQSVRKEHVLLLNGFKEADLEILLKGSVSEPSEEPRVGGWLGAYFNTEHNASVWRDTIEATGKALWEKLMAPVAERLATLKVTHILLMPQGGLGLLPLHAAWHEIDGTRRYFLDDYAVTYLPSAYAHQVSLKRIADTQLHECSLLAVINPTKDLSFAATEGEHVAKLFEKKNATVLSGHECTVNAIMKQITATYVHFSCHASYEWDDPMQSGLELANQESLTLAQIIGHFNLDNTRLVTLSACETGITDIRQSPDEYLGLPAGFLQAGAPAVISSLWAVDDLSTMLLMERFYQLHLKDGTDLPVALRHAQIWLREVTAGELAQRFGDEEDALLSSTRMPIKTASDYFARFTAQESAQRPFAHPYYWAAFTFSGA